MSELSVYIEGKFPTFMFKTDTLIVFMKTFNEVFLKKKQKTKNKMEKLALEHSH
jgi:hypothetical protein